MTEVAHSIYCLESTVIHENRENNKIKWVKQWKTRPYTVSFQHGKLNPEIDQSDIQYILFRVRVINEKRENNQKMGQTNNNGKNNEILYIKVYKFITQFQTLDYTVSSQHGKLNPETDQCGTQTVYIVESENNS